MAEAARRYGSGLGADVARRLIARPIQRQATLAPRQTAQPHHAAQRHDTAQERRVEPAPSGPIVTPDLTRKLEAQILVMKAVLAAERRENENLRVCIGMEDDTLGEEAREVRDRWAGLVDKLLQAAV